MHIKDTHQTYGDKKGIKETTSGVRPINFHDLVCKLTGAWSKVKLKLLTDPKMI